MKTKILKITAKAGQCFLPILLFAVLLGGCSDDDALQTPLAPPHVTTDHVTVSSLTFTWDKVEGVSSYSCELKDPYGEVVDGTVTVSTTATFTGLQPNTTYTLEVYAYAAVGSDNTTSQAATLTATTAAVVTLKMGGLTVEVKGTTAVISWEEVEHAENYAYTYMAGGEEVTGITEETELTLRQLAQGDYRVSVSAVPAEADEAHAVSPAASVTFTIAQEKTALWTATGTYTSAVLNSSWEARLTAWNDDSYTLSGWYGVEGHDLTFTVNGNGEIGLSDYEEDGGYFYVPTGLSEYAGVWIYPSDGYSSFESDAKEGGSLWFYADDGYDQFVWEAVSLP
ncbi:MAG: fibronectin type III domain-containing protein [Bacteroides sp.]|uniref:fibronectin type III domain-containing protein n=1 Tax=Bacteroides sp. TaxID=29523 RepID=UPI0026DFA46B|nr:fibronectin type III domain-containing protein [Bacteroides sp.]MDO5419979.1 fibronectin type III domain-containing protein [Bacteroides sp.]